MRGVFAGSGSDGLNDKRVCDAICGVLTRARGGSPGEWATNLNLAQAPEVNIVYLGTATYDKVAPRDKQTKTLLGTFMQAGLACNFCPLSIMAPPVKGTCSEEEFQETTFQYNLQQSCWRSKISNAHVIVVSGGNTLYAITMWRAAGLITALCKARDRGAVLCGGSAGAICWFDAGHSDSADPDSFRSNFSKELPEDSTNKSWNYIRVGGLGFLPGLVCPHFDKVQSNGVLRRDDFETMLLRQPLDVGLGIDHWAALVIDDDQFSTINCGKENPGTLGEEAGVFLCRIIKGKMRFHRLCKQGQTEDLLHWLRPENEDKSVTKQVMSLNPLQTFPNFFL